LRDPISKIPTTKRAGGVAEGVSPEFRPHYYKTHTQTKTMLTYGSEEPGNFHPIISEWRGAKVVPGPGEGGLWARPGQSTDTAILSHIFFYEFLTFPNSSLPQEGSCLASVRS
jgi:hypothetical protein